MDLTIETIAALAQIMASDQLTSLSVDQGHLKIELKREYGTLNSSPATVSATLKNPLTPENTITKQDEPIDPRIIAVNSPMVGVFYESSKPGDQPFVSVGDSFSKGDTLCIIEAMKLMNELSAEEDGEIIEVNVKNGEVVEFGQVLFRIRKGV